MLTIPTTPNPTTTPTTSKPAALPASRTAPAAPTYPGSAIMSDPVTAGVLLSAWSGDACELVPAPPGSGKTRLVVLLAAALAARAGLRVGIAAQTRSQATELACRFNQLPYAAHLRWGRTTLPDLGPGPVTTNSATTFPAKGGGVCIATTARWLMSRRADATCDVMIVDEAWQATYADLGALGAFAAQLVAVGDPGQIDPVVTGPTNRWTGNPTAPHLPGPDALLAAHGDAVSVVKLRHTYRLGPATTALIQPIFYPHLPFTSRRPDEHLTLPNGTDLPELAHASIPTTAGPSDPALTLACATLARELTTATYTTATGIRPMTAHDVAVVTPHVNQAATVRAMLADLPGILVGTANSLQGLERAAVIALHPLAGYRDPAHFGTDLGRACVMLSRHRAHLTVVTDPHTATVLNRDTTPNGQTHLDLFRTITTTPTR